MRGLLAMLAVGCDGRRPEMARQTLGGRSLLDLAIDQVAEAGPDLVLASLPASRPRAAMPTGRIECLVRPAGCDTLEDALAHALLRVVAVGPAAVAARLSHVLAIDPLLPMRQPGRLAQAVALAAREGAHCVFSCHRESSLLWHRSAMGLVPYFDPAQRPGPGGGAGDLPWLREDGGFYLLDISSFRKMRCRHSGRLFPLETTPEEAVAANGPAGLAACRALAAERARAAVAG